MTDSIKILKDVIGRAEQSNKFCNMLIAVRNIHENDEQTLARVIVERQQIVELLRDLGEPFEPFDHKLTYGAYLAERLRKYVYTKHIAKHDPSGYGWHVVGPSLHKPIHFEEGQCVDGFSTEMRARNKAAQLNKEPFPFPREDIK